MSYQQLNPENPPYQSQPSRPAKLRSDFSLEKYLLFILLTAGIYHFVVMVRLIKNVNTIISPYDGKKTMNIIGASLLGILTLGIYTFVWYHKLSDRVGDEVRRRNIASDFSSSTFWLWHVLGAFVIFGPFVYFDRLFDAVNALSENYNHYGY